MNPEHFLQPNGIRPCVSTIDSQGKAGMYPIPCACFVSAVVGVATCLFPDINPDPVYKDLVGRSCNSLRSSTNSRTQLSCHTFPGYLLHKR